MLHQAVISLGSNTADKELKLREAIEILGVKIVQSSGAYDDPVDNNPGHPYLNLIAWIETELDHDALRVHFKELEGRLGRDRRSDTVAIDIDIVIFDGTVMRPTDFARPYFQTGYKLMHDA
ncbi:MAG: 2-amino-4-hydroxy-6-hydroxymethyldihydropteridine diphosphokinase [Muribaculaceae bacterium]|nr:2-amino-4-hydroxy-6-hydroxymethyldihydropteridine diphosphokinase [Muribaculaceae bacterium]